MPTFDSQVKFTKIPTVDLVAPQAAAASPPASPIAGQLWYDTTNNQLKVCTNATGPVWTQCDNAAVANLTDGDKGDITISSGIWTIDNLVVTAAKIANATITDTQIAAGNKDGTTAVPSMRTLGFSGNSAMPGTASLNQLASPTALINMNGQRLTQLGASAAGTDAVNRNELDAVAAGLDSKGSVRVATTANITLSGTQTIDTVAVVVGDRVLVMNQSTAANNGIYVVASGAWTRATDMDSWIEVPGAYTFVEDGSANINNGYVCTSKAGGTLGTTAITWTQFSGAGQITDGIGLLKTGNTLDVRLDNTTIEAPSDILQVKAGGIGGTQLATGAVDLTTAKVAGILPPAKGGTGADATTAAGQLSVRQNLGVMGQYATLSPSLTAGVWATITHNMQSRARHVSFEEVSSGEGRLLDWRVNSTNPLTQIDIRCDVPGGRAASYYNVNVGC